MRPAFCFRACFTLLFVVTTNMATTMSVSGEDKFAWKNDDAAGTADLMYGDLPVVRYMYAFDVSSPERREETYKVYHHVFGPGTKEVITKGPGGLFPHHRGLYIGWMKTKFEGGEYDFWHCKKDAHQRHVKFLKQEGDASHGVMTAEIGWNDPMGAPVVIENRTVAAKKFPQAKGFGWQIDWSTVLNSKRGEIQLDGDRQHAGFQFRASNTVADEKSARYLRPTGFPEQPEAYEVNDMPPVKHTDLNWLAMTYPLGGKKYTIVYLEDPSLPKPSLYSERPYGRFGAFFKATLPADKPMTIQYRVLVLVDSEPKREDVQGWYDAFVKDLASKK